MPLNGSQSVQLAVGTPAEVASELAQFIRRATFTTYLNPIEAHLPRKEGKCGAPLMVSGAEAVMIELGEIHLDHTAHME